MMARCRTRHDRMAHENSMRLRSRCMGLEPISSSLQAAQDLRIRSIFWNRFELLQILVRTGKNSASNSLYTRLLWTARDGLWDLRPRWVKWHSNCLAERNKNLGSKQISEQSVVVFIRLSLSGLKVKLHRLQNQVHSGQNRRRLGLWVYKELSSTGQQWRRSDC